MIVRSTQPEFKHHVQSLMCFLGNWNAVIVYSLFLLLALDVLVIL